MGEYVHASITIRGHIPSVEAFDELVNAIEGKDLAASNGLKTRAALVKEFALSLRKQDNAYFEDGDVNYGNLEEVTSICQEYAIAYERTSEAAGGSDPEEACWYPGDGDEFSTEDTVLDAWELEKLLDAPDLEAAVRAKVAEMKRAAGGDLPTMSVSDDVRDLLAVEMGRAAVLAA